MLLWWVCPDIREIQVERQQNSAFRSHMLYDSFVISTGERLVPDGLSIEPRLAQCFCGIEGKVLVDFITSRAQLKGEFHRALARQLGGIS
jgi:hypothetical protein